MGLGGKWIGIIGLSSPVWESSLRRLLASLLRGDGLFSPRWSVGEIVASRSTSRVSGAGIIENTVLGGLTGEASVGWGGGLLSGDRGEASAVLLVGN